MLGKIQASLESATSVFILTTKISQIMSRCNRMLFTAYTHICTHSSLPKDLTLQLHIKERGCTNRKDVFVDLNKMYQPDFQIHIRIRYSTIFSEAMKILMEKTCFSSNV